MSVILSQVRLNSPPVRPFESLRAALGTVEGRLKPDVTDP